MSGNVLALAEFEGAGGSALYVGGEFVSSPAGDGYLAKWGSRPKDTVKRRRL